MFMDGVDSFSENGVCPFDTKKPLDDNPYAGTHVIRWERADSLL